MKPLSLYWKCQIIGWSMASLYWGYLGFKASDFSVPLAIAHFITDVSIYILLTHLFRNFSKKRGWDDLSIGRLTIRLIPAALVLGCLYVIFTFNKLYWVDRLFNADIKAGYVEFFNSNLEIWFIAGVRLMSIWLLAYYLYHYAQREIRTIKENSRLALIAKEAQLNNLTAQLNPHFFFNSLNAIKGLMIEDPKLAMRGIDWLSDLLRNSLYKKDSALISLKDEMCLVKDYLELEKIRFEDRLNFSIEIPQELLSTQVVPFSIQMLVDNAVKHGINKEINGGSIRVKVCRQSNGQILILVESPGKLEIKKEKAGIGLANLQERLQLQFNNRAQFSLKETNNIVSATMLIPAA